MLLVDVICSFINKM